MLNQHVNYCFNDIYKQYRFSKRKKHLYNFKTKFLRNNKHNTLIKNYITYYLEII